MMLRRPVAQAAQTRCGPIHEPHSVFARRGFTIETKVVAVMLILEGFETPNAHMVAIEGYGISLPHSAIF